MDKHTNTKVTLPYSPINRFWKPLLFFPILLLVFSVALLSYTFVTTGDFVKKDIELSGGKLIEVQVFDVDVNLVRQELPFASIRLITGVTNNLLVQFPNELDEFEVYESLRQVANVSDNPSYRTVSPILGDVFFQQAQLAIIVAFIFMGIVVFILFRSFIPSIAVILAAATDIIATVAVMNLVGIELSLPVLAALLTLIGYSVDTDILLTSRLLKSGMLPLDSIPDRINLAMKTGLTLSITTLAALTALFIITNSFVLEQIAIVLIIGLVIDVFVTWLTNAGILRWWLIRRANAH
jgi:preprotein translocase subunit SecF